MREMNCKLILLLFLTTSHAKGFARQRGYWDMFCLLYDITNFDLNNVKSNKNLFNLMSISWDLAKPYLQQDLDAETYGFIDTFYTELANKLEE